MADKKAPNDNQEKEGYKLVKPTDPDCDEDLPEDFTGEPKESYLDLTKESKTFNKNAWNDPPPKLLDAAKLSGVKSAQGSLKPKLTDRVAFPINGPPQSTTQASPSAPLDPSGPPPTTGFKPLQAPPRVVNQGTKPPPLTNRGNEPPPLTGELREANSTTPSVNED